MQFGHQVDIGTHTPTTYVHTKAYINISQIDPCSPTATYILNAQVKPCKVAQHDSRTLIRGVTKQQNTAPLVFDRNVWDIEQVFIRRLRGPLMNHLGRAFGDSSLLQLLVLLHTNIY